MRWSCVATVCTIVPFSLQQPAEPRDGHEVLARMHAAYAGRWYSSVAFVQRTTFIKPAGERDTATWYESLLGPNQLRIDLGPPGAGRGVIFTAESTYVFKDGRRTRVGGDGNPFLPLIMGVYLEPAESAGRRAVHHGFDLAKFHVSNAAGRRAYVVGSLADADTTSPQFWVDAERLVVHRIRVTVKSPNAAPDAQLDVQLGDDVAIGGGWLSTHVQIAKDGTPVQLEDYTEWSDRVAIPDSLFDRSHWVTGGHWATLLRSPSLWTEHR